MASFLAGSLLVYSVRAATFTYTAVGSERYPTPLPSSLTFATPFGPHATQATKLLPANVTYTTYTYDATSTFPHDGLYGQSAYNALWNAANFSYPSTIPFSTTVSPTPVPSSELVFPPPLPFPTPTGDDYELPEGFIWGVAGSAWQIEGALQSEGRGPSPRVDKLGGLPAADNYDNGVTNDMNYYLYKQDLARLAALGVPHYSFSISWSRILPFGVANSPVNLQGLAHYDDLINTCLKYGITPVATLWHYDSPSLVNFNEDSAIEHFLYYAKVVMAYYGDRIPIWQTFNEANIFQFGGPNAFRRILLAHAEVYHWYKSVYKGNGKISMKLANDMAYPLHGPSNASDVAAALRYQDFVLGIMGNPLFLGQQVPANVLNTTGLGVTSLSAAEITRINGSIDFWSLDPYTAQLATAPPSGVEACAANPSDPHWPSCVVLSSTQADGWLMGAASNSYVYIAPQYMRQQLKYVWDVFRPRGGILISEIGFPVQNEALKTLPQQQFDIERSLYYNAFLSEALKAVHEDGVPVIGAFAWSFVDNNEWGQDVNQFGMQAVNMTDGTFTRTYKRSFFDFIDFFKSRVPLG
ncbi:beta-glucosidase [Xylariales sp. PMI_506]|nr:beta-glucosidase [Xylariales sp. PMI_506]